MQIKFNSIDFLTIVVIMALIVNAIVLFYYVYEMANTRGRSAFYWIFFSLFATPVTGIILLACVGETEEKRIERLYQDEEYLRKMRD